MQIFYKGILLFWKITSNIGMNPSAMPTGNLTPKHNPKHQHSLDNSPAFFTGCVESIRIVSRIPSLCEKCYCILPKTLLSPDKLLNDIVNASETVDQRTCDNCLKTKKDGSPVSSKELEDSISLSSLQDIAASIDEHNKKHSLTPESSIVRRTLLPLPSSSMSNSNAFDGKDHSTRNSKPSTVTSSLKKPFDSPKNNAEETQISVQKRKNGHPDDDLSTKRFRSSPAHKLQPSDDELSKNIWKLFLENKQTQAVYEKKMTLRNQLHNILLNRFPNCGLYVVGSSMSGLGANSSDMDMCLMLTHSEIDQEKEATDILHVVHDLFLQFDFLLDVEVIYAKVPILRFRDVISGIEVDLNINNAVGIRNTQLLTSYARIDERFPPLVLLTKLWARFHGINDAKNNTLSSYSLVLMVIHYLQYGCQPSVLPCLQKLQPEKFHPHSDVRNLKLLEDLPDFISKNKKNVGDLFLGFLEYFANDFSFQESVISVRLGHVVPKQTAMISQSPKNKKGHWKFVCIEEPFDLTNTARAVFKPDAFYYLKQVFDKSWHRLRKTANLDNIFNE